MENNNVEMEGAGAEMEGANIEFKERMRARTDAFLRGFPLPLTILMEDQVIDYTAWLAETEKTDALSPAPFEGKSGGLYLGKKKIADVSFVKDDHGTAVEMINPLVDFGVNGLEGILMDTTFVVSAEIGAKDIPLDDAMRLGNGSIIEFDRLAGEPVDLFIENPRYRIGFGEAVVIDENMGIRTTEVLDPLSVTEEVPTEISGVPRVRAHLVLGRAAIPMRDIVGMGEGTIFRLCSLCGEPVEVVFDSGLVMKAEVIVIGECFGARIVVNEECESLCFPEAGNGDPGTAAMEKETVGTVNPPPLEHLNRPFDFLGNANPSDLLSCIQAEHPQTIALIISHLEPVKASAILQNLPGEIQAEVARRIARMDRTSPLVLRMTERVLERKIAGLPGEDYSASGGVDAIAELLNRVDRTTEKTIVENLEKEDPELASEIKERMFVFEDIVMLDDRTIQRVLREVGVRDLAVALRSMDSEIQEKIFRNMSKRASDMLKDDMDCMGPLLMKHVMEARLKIISVIRRLEEYGEIVIARWGEDELVL